MKRILGLLLCINLLLVIILCINLSLVISCSDDGPAKTLLSSFEVTLKSANSIPMVADRNESGTAVLELYDDNTLMFAIMVNNLSSSDKLNISRIHSGDVVSTGAAEIVLVGGNEISFSGNFASGTIQLTQDQVSLLQGEGIYLNVHSEESPQGLIRGQVGHDIDDAYDVALSRNNEVPPVTNRNEEGVIYMRTVDDMLYYRVEININNLAASDAITGGYIHEGSSTENGDGFLNLEVSDNNQINISKSLQLDDAEIDKLNSDPLYVNV
ncbi:CHRD domain-containing protein, partial [Galbibacter sp. EGI 63066]|uniref:CHRD domain-containing protein n=1 Tax=Galbibacter sp. EGI 63066 TaxID=2993559 RepID=UPI0022493C8A